jgi:hypothetical protein
MRLFSHCRRGPADPAGEEFHKCARHLMDAVDWAAGAWPGFLPSTRAESKLFCPSQG